MTRVLSIGHTTASRSPDGSARTRFGGDTFTTAYLARLDSGFRQNTVNETIPEAKSHVHDVRIARESRSCGAA